MTSPSDLRETFSSIVLSSGKPLYILTDDAFPFLEAPEDQGLGDEELAATNILRVFLTQEGAEEYHASVRQFDESVKVTPMTVEELWSFHCALKDGLLAVGLKDSKWAPRTKILLCQIYPGEFPQSLDVLFADTETVH